MDFADAHPDLDIWCLIQATCFRVLWSCLNHQADSLVTAVRTHRFLWPDDKVQARPKTGNYNLVKRARRQDPDGELIGIVAFYITCELLFNKTHCRPGFRFKSTPRGRLQNGVNHGALVVSCPFATDWSLVRPGPPTRPAT